MRIVVRGLARRIARPVFVPFVSARLPNVVDATRRNECPRASLHLGMDWIFQSRINVVVLRHLEQSCPDFLDRGLTKDAVLGQLRRRLAVGLASRHPENSSAP